MKDRKDRKDRKTGRKDNNQQPQHHRPQHLDVKPQAQTSTLNSNRLNFTCLQLHPHHLHSNRTSVWAVLPCCHLRQLEQTRVNAKKESSEKARDSRRSRSARGLYFSCNRKSHNSWSCQLPAHQYHRHP